jgi:protein SCO1/2
MRRMSRLLPALLWLALSLGSAHAQADDERRLALSGPLALTDADGTPVHTSDYGKWLLVYFGYTHCADLCPTGLTLLADAMDQIGPAARYVQPLFVTVDPAHDRGPMLRAFTASFDKRLIGLTGSDDQIAAAAKALGVVYEKVTLANGDYTVDHSSSLALIEPSGRSALTFKMSEPHLVAAKIFHALALAGVDLRDVPNLQAYR